MSIRVFQIIDGVSYEFDAKPATSNLSMLDLEWLLNFFYPVGGCGIKRSTRLVAARLAPHRCVDDATSCYVLQAPVPVDVSVCWRIRNACKT